MLQRMLVEKMENRILVGLLAFLGIMIMVGFVAIKENARMASFTAQFQARSIERGGELFASQCATCHNPDGRGIVGRAPALNNPHFFGHNYVAQYDDQILALETERLSLENERIALANELAGGANERRQSEIQTRFAEIEPRLGSEGIDAEITAIQAEREEVLGQFIAAVDIGYDPENDRLQQANWSGTLDEYVYTTMVHGRGQNAQLWNGNVMPPWLQPTGPMRDDQVRDVVAYIMNWDKGSNWTADDLLAVNQFAIVPGTGGGETASAEPAGDDVEAILAQWEADGIVGDPVRGGELYVSARTQRGAVLGCSGCHTGSSPQGPPWEGTWERTINERLQEPQFAGYTPEQYLLESIVQPNVYIVPGYNPTMPDSFGESTGVQDLADLIAYLHSSDPNYSAPESDTTQQSTDNSAAVTTNADEPPAVTEEAASTAEADNDPNILQDIPGGTTTAPEDPDQ